MFLSVYDMDYFGNKKGKKLKKEGESLEGSVWNEGNPDLPTADQVERREPDKTRKGFGVVLKGLMGLGDLFTGGKVTEITKDYVFPVFDAMYGAFGSKEQKRKLEDLEVATFGLQDSNNDLVKVRTPQPMNPFAPQGGGRATAQNAFGLLNKADSVKYDQYEASHPRTAYVDRWHMTTVEDPDSKKKKQKRDISSGLNAFSSWR